MITDRRYLRDSADASHFNSVNDMLLNHYHMSSVSNHKKIMHMPIANKEKGVLLEYISVLKARQRGPFLGWEALFSTGKIFSNLLLKTKKEVEE